MNLNVGDFQILGRVQKFPLRHWFHAINQATGQEVIVFPCSVPDYKVKSCLDFGWLRSQFVVEADGLQVFDYLSVNAALLPNGRLLQGIIVSNLPHGYDLGVWLKGAGMLRRAEAIAMGKAIGVGLSAIHKASLAHGELSPSRIWVGNDGNVLLLKTVRAISVSSENSLLPLHDWFEEDVWGQTFISPELRFGTHGIDSCTDMFSLGAVILYIAMGENFRPDRFQVELDQLRLSESRDPLIRLLGLCLESDRSKRLSSIDDFLDALGELDSQASTGQSLNQMQPVSSERWAKNWKSIYGSYTSTGHDLVMSSPKSISNNTFSNELTTSASIKHPFNNRVALVNTNPSKSKVGDFKDPKSSRTQNSNRAKKRQLKTLSIAVSVSVLLLVFSLVVPYFFKQGTVTTSDYPFREKPFAREGKVGSNSKTSISGDKSGSSDADAVAENSNFLWESPWSLGTQSASLELVVPGAELIVAIRPASILENEVSKYWRLWFPHEYSLVLNEIEQSLGVNLSFVDRVVVSSIEVEGGGQNALWSVFLNRPIAIKTIKDKLVVQKNETGLEPSISVPTQKDSEIKLFFQEGHQRDDYMVERYALGSKSVIDLVSDISGSSIPLPNAMQTAWDQTSEKADITLLLSPLFLSRYQSGALGKFWSLGLRDVFEWLSANISALVLSADVAENIYCEILLVPTTGTSSPTALVEIKKAIDGLPEKIERIVGQGEISPYWQSLAIRLPKLAEFARNNARFGYSNLLPSVNIYLPVPFIPQVCLAALLLLSQNKPVQNSYFNIPEKKELSADQILEKSLSISFEQESLEQALKILFDEYEHSNSQNQPFLELQLDGASLEKSGITQNQQVRDFKMLDSTFRSILTALLVRANPDKTATIAKDSRQSLIWALKQDLVKNAVSIVVTTRQGALLQGLTLPPEFLETQPTIPKSP